MANARRDYVLKWRASGDGEKERRGGGGERKGEKKKDETRAIFFAARYEEAGLLRLVFNRKTFHREPVTLIRSKNQDRANFRTFYHARADTFFAWLFDMSDNRLNIRFSLREIEIDFVSSLSHLLS